MQQAADVKRWLMRLERNYKYLLHTLEIVWKPMRVNKLYLYAGKEDKEYAGEYG